MACSNDHSTLTELRQLSPQPSTSKEDKATMVSPSTEHKATMTSPMFAYNSPEKCRLRQRVKFLQTEMRMKMQAMRQKLRRIRHYGGGNNNPTVRQFKAAMKKILVHADIRGTSTGNCIPLERIAILHVSSFNNATNSEHIINSTSRLARIYNESNDTESNDSENFFQEHNYV